MTTCAYSVTHDQLAADTLAVYGSMQCKDRKLFVVRDNRIALAGDSEDSEKFLAWMRKDDGSKPPKLKEISAIIVNDEGVFQYDGGKVYQPIYDDFVAIGSGAMSAMALMRDGCSPYEAILKTCEVDVYTGPPVETI